MPQIQWKTSLKSYPLSFLWLCPYPNLNYNG